MERKSLREWVFTSAHIITELSFNIAIGMVFIGHVGAMYKKMQCCLGIGDQLSNPYLGAE